MVPLNFADNAYLVQFNFNYNASDGSPQVFRSPTFTVDNSLQSRAITWSEDVLALSTSSASTALQTSIPASLITSSASSTPSTTRDRPPSVLYSSATSPPLSFSKASSANGSDLGSGAIAGIVLGVIVCAGLAAALLFSFHRLRKPNNIQAAVKARSSASFQSPVPANFVGEKDGSPVRPNELSGDFPISEMPTEGR